ncbi:PQ-loop repeat [Trinorchestia longiramus]|nr:PQ-loop repeat [Trinorchestia longiramus]
MACRVRHPNITALITSVDQKWMTMNTDYVDKTCKTFRSRLESIIAVDGDFDYRYFWEWTDVQSYIEFILTFATLGCLGMYVFLDKSWFVETIGFAALITEAMLAAPQFYKNLKNRSTVGMSRKMVLMWLSGDVFKTVYFYLRAAPVQFFICGALQVLIDLAVIGQCFIYPNKNKSLVK